MDDTTETLQLNESDELAIRDIVSQAQAAQNHVEPLMKLHTPGAIIVNIAGKRVLGRDAFAAAMTAALSSALKSVRTELEIVDIRMATPDVAIVSCVKTVHDDRDAAENATSLPTAGALTYVMNRAEGTWRIALAQTTPVAQAVEA